jgi:hypothetical protein
VAPKPGKGKGKGKGRGRRKGLSSLYDPATSLSGRPLKAAAKAATKLELQSGINAQKAALAASRRGQAYDVRALGNMGQRLDERMGGLVSNVATYGKEANTRAAGLSADLQANLAASNQQATDRLNTLQGSVLGDQVSNLTSQDIAPGANTKALAGMMAQQQAGANQQQSSWNNLGAVLGSMNQASTAGMSDAAYYGARNERENVARNINTRIADRRQMGAEERAKTRSELATIRGLRGATTLKNLMELRREQQDYGSRKAEIAATLRNQKAENAIDWYNAITKRRDQQADAKNGGSGGGSGGDGNDNRMNGQEWRQWRSALKTEIERYPGEPITNWNTVLDNIGSAEGVSWTPRERRQFKRRAKKWYSKKYG